MGRLELPMPELGTDSLSWAAKDLEKRIRIQTPESMRNLIVVRPYRKDGRTGISVEYPDPAERYVQVAIEYPKDSPRHEDAVPHRRR